jgi:elongation factor 3
VRAFGEAALDTLLKSGASSTAQPPQRRDVQGETSEALTALRNLFPNKNLISQTSIDRPNLTGHPLLDTSLEFQASLVADLVHFRKFGSKESWGRCVGVYSALWLDKEEAAKFAETVRLHFQAIDQVLFLYLSHRILLNLETTSIGQVGLYPEWFFRRRRSSL